MDWGDYVKIMVQAAGAFVLLMMLAALVASTASTIRDRWKRDK